MRPATARDRTTQDDNARREGDEGREEGKGNAEVHALAIGRAQATQGGGSIVSPEQGAEEALRRRQLPLGLRHQLQRLLLVVGHLDDDLFFPLCPGTRSPLTQAVKRPDSSTATQ